MPSRKNEYLTNKHRSSTRGEKNEERLKNIRFDLRFTLIL
jgi:hypothetical protein